MLPIALNHMAAPGLRFDAFLDLARALGCAGVEFRNDLPGPLFDGVAPEAVAQAAGDLRILALAEIKCFNDWSDAKAAEADRLMRIATACGAEAVSLIPRNDGLGLGHGERQANLRVALRELLPMLDRHGLIGLIEPLGFESSSLRHKSDAVDAIEALGATGRFRLIHDTFHHAIAGGGPVFAAQTGIVHLSGVTDPTLSLSDMRDGHRGLVDGDDRLGNVAQIKQLVMDGYDGPLSFEPFSPDVHDLADPHAAFSRSFDFISGQLADRAA